MKEVIIYTDGACSKNPGPGGYGAVLIHKGKRKEISEGYKHTTNNRMELLAAIKALEILKESCDVQLYSDSRYLVDAVNKKWIDGWIKRNWINSMRKPVLNIDLWKRIVELIKKHNVKFIWVKGHADNVENERCDFLARQAIESENLLIDENYIS